MSSKVFLTLIRSCPAVLLAGILLSSCGGSTDQVASGSAVGTEIPSGASANATLSFPSVVSGVDTFLAASQAVYLGPMEYKSDASAVVDGTGKGVWIGVIDDFSTLHDATFRFPSLTRQKVTKSAGSSSSDSTTQTTSCLIPHSLGTKWAHGDLVSKIAGGVTPAQTKSVSLDLTKYNTNPECAGSFYGSLSVGLDSLLISQPIKGVASDASVQRYPVILGDVSDAKLQLATILGHLRNALSDPGHAIGVVNMSLGSDIGTSIGSKQQIIDAVLAGYSIIDPVDTVITVAAGNSSLACGEVDLVGCNLVAVALASQDTTKGSLIVVGALTGEGAAQGIALYSNFPGYLKNRFIWASGESYTDSDSSGRWAVGTSFAAPRVAGAAAILRQKYPALTSVQIADLILDSADRDMNNDGVEDFVGPHNTWGRGKLNLSNALKLAQTRYP